MQVTSFQTTQTAFRAAISRRSAVRLGLALAAACWLAACGGGGGASAANSAAASAGPTSAAFYVSPSGSDGNSGASAAAPFATLERAQTAMRSSTVKTTYLLGGTYARTVPLVLSAADAGESWLGYPGQVPVLDGGSSTAEALSIHADGVTVRWLTIRNFSLNGIQTYNATSVTIDSNVVENIYSTGWDQGGIALMYTATNNQVTHNVLRNLNYAGILVSNGATNNASDLRIEGNAVYASCKVVADCGAIYANDRGHTSTGITISANVVADYGTTSNQSKGIYLDDELSHATVEGNLVYGAGMYALQIHGGDHNVFRNNVFDISGARMLALYQDDLPAKDYGMAANEFRCNIVYTTAASPPELWNTNLTATDALPMVAGNQYWSTVGTLSALGIIVDSQPSVANPAFVDPSQGNYGVAGSAPPGCNFQPILSAAAGPLSNP